jgi:hypothetical protein
MISKYLNLKIIIIFAVTLRLFTVIFLFDFHSENYWEYGAIAENICNGRGYSLFYIENGKVEHKFNKKFDVYPSAYMPPMYVFRLLPFFAVKNVALRNILFLISNIILSVAIILMLYKLTAIYFDEKIAMISAFIYTLLPEFLFATLGFTPVLEFHFFILYLLFHLAKESKLQLLHIFVGVFLLIAMRSELIAYVFILMLFLLKLRNYKKALTVAFAVLLFVIPWSIRNYYVFNEFIPTTTNSGVNLYRGHNPVGPGLWGVSGTDSVLMKYKDTKNFELMLNKTYSDAAINFITNNPQITIINSFKKVFYLWLFNPDDPRSFQPLYIAPWIFLLLTSILGLKKTFNTSKYKYVYTLLILQTIMSILFFAIPRYQTMLKIILIPFASYAFSIFIDLIKNRYFNQRNIER